MVSRMPGVSARRIEEGLRSTPPTSEAKPSREYVYDGPPPRAEVVHARVAAMAVLPRALAVACTAHDVPVDVPCFGRAGERGSGVCGMRLALRTRGGS